MQEALESLPEVSTVFESDANFLLVRFNDAEAVAGYLLDRGIVVRTMRQYPAIADCLRISIGTETENSQLLQALTAFCRASHA
jgi:histidinol-phosphate/aromatic aminotransferase/cobyric acid decarboxylase-like protein